MSDQTTGPILWEAAAPGASVLDTAPAAAAAPTPGAYPEPTIRWGALAWGLIFAAVAGAVLYTTTDAGRRDAVSAWLDSSGPVEATFSSVLALGALAAVFGVVGLIRRGERVRAERDTERRETDGFPS